MSVCRYCGQKVGWFSEAHEGLSWKLRRSKHKGRERTLLSFWRDSWPQGTVNISARSGLRIFPDDHTRRIFRRSRERCQLPLAVQTNRAFPAVFGCSGHLQERRQRENLRSATGDGDWLVPVQHPTIARRQGV